MALRRKAFSNLTTRNWRGRGVIGGSGHSLLGGLRKSRKKNSV